jgi:hypothetical protein
MKKILPYLFASAISIIALFSSFAMADPELGISTALVTWLGFFWLMSGNRNDEGCLS